MLDAAVTLPDEKEAVMFVGYIAHEPGGGLHDLFQIRGDASPVDRFGDVLQRRFVRHALDLEDDVFLVAQEDGAIVKGVEIRGEKGPGPARDRVEAGCDLRPARGNIQNNRDRMPEPAGQIKEHPRRGDKGPLFVQIVLGGEIDKARDVVLHGHRGGIPGRHAPAAAGDLLPGQGPAAAVRGPEIRDLRFIVQYLVKTRHPSGHLEIEQLALDPLAAQDHMEKMLGRAGHRDPESQAAVGG